MRLAHVEALAKRNRALSLFSKAMPARAMRRILPTSRSGLSYLSTTDSGTGTSPTCIACHGIWKVAPDEQLPDVCENCLHQKCAPTSCTVWSPSRHLQKERFRQQVAKGICLCWPSRGAPQLQFFSNLTAVSRAQLALEQRTYATMMNEFDTFFIPWRR